MREDAENGEEEGEAVDDAEQKLEGHDRVNELGEEALRDDGVLFDEFREVVEAGGYIGSTSAKVKVYWVRFKAIRTIARLIRQSPTDIGKKVGGIQTIFRGIWRKDKGI